MIYVSLYYFIFVFATVFIYYIVPCKSRWYVLLLGSLVFYYWLSNNAYVIEKISIFLGTAILCYSFSIINHRIHSRILLFFELFLILLPLLCIKISEGLSVKFFEKKQLSLIIPIGISFYSLQLVSYIIDSWQGRILPERNIFKFILFVTFFPQIIQGPIPRYKDLQHQITRGNKWNERQFVSGMLTVLWGFFLKFMLADKIGVVVDTVYNDIPLYSGGVFWIAAVGYSIQLYTDFLSCVKIAQGVSLMFGIHLQDNFRNPYFSKSISEFWRRWHISLSSWLRDYIYIPLGGNRKGKLRKYFNIFVTFLVSGVWHGGQLKYIIWGLIHAVYQVVEICIHEVINNDRKKNVEDNYGRRGIQFLKILFTFLLVTVAWIIFRAPDLESGCYIIKKMFSSFEPWVLFNDIIFTLGLDWKEWMVLLLSLLVLIIVSVNQENRISIKELVLDQNIFVRWFIYIATISAIWIFGTYGYGYDVRDFIYGGF